ncbi:MAG: HAD family hydrolase [Myxococcales bacterium]|nr:HAD family hydrolase [Myxococcales bacterium]
MLPLVLFDIDGTLLRTRGAGREALDAAFLKLHDWPDATEGVHVAGSTDDAICRDVAVRFGESWSPSRTVALRAVYLRELARLLAPAERTEVLPGVVPLLDQLDGRAHVALLTGNWRSGADVKLGAASLGHRFDWGVYSEDAWERDGLVPAARRLADARGLVVGEVVVIGDTVADVRCARAGAARVVVVETGFCLPADLALARPDLQVTTLEAGLGWIVTLVTAA